MSAAAVLSAAKLMCGMLYVTKLFVVGVWLLSTQTDVTRRELRCLKSFKSLMVPVGACQHITVTKQEEHPRYH